MSELKRTPLNDYYHEQGAKLVDFGGWEMPVQFSSIKEEHTAVREDVGIFDVSHMGEILVTGNQAEEFLNYALTNDISKLTDVKAQYTAITNENGGVIDDLVVYKLQENEYLLIPNAGNTDTDFEWLKSIEGYDVTVENVSSDYGQLAIQGPNARALVQKFTETDLSDLKMFNFVTGAQVDGKDVIISQSGYTGEDGF